MLDALDLNLGLENVGYFQFDVQSVAYVLQHCFVAHINILLILDLEHLGVFGL